MATADISNYGTIVAVHSMVCNITNNTHLHFYGSFGVSINKQIGSWTSFGSVDFYDPNHKEKYISYNHATVSGIAINLNTGKSYQIIINDQGSFGNLDIVIPTGKYVMIFL